MVMMASLNAVCVCAYHHADWGARCGRPFETPDHSKLFHDQILWSMQGVEEWQKIQGCSGGRKVHDRFLEISTKSSTFELTTRKSRTLGVDQKFLIFWRPRYFICSYPSECCQTSSSLPAGSWHPPVDTAECNQPSDPRRRSAGSTSGQGPSWTQSLLATEVSTASHVVPQLPAPSARVAAAEAWWRVCRGVNGRSKAPATPASDIKLASPNSPHSKAWL